MKALGWVTTLALLVWATPALAQDEEAPAEEAGDESAAGEDAATGDEAAADDPAASPDVQEQVGMATEKEDAVEEPPPEEDTGPAEPSREVGEEDEYGHGMQFGLRAGVVLGYKMVFRYNDSPFCTDPTYDQPDGDPVDEQQAICGFGASPGVEVAISFAPLDSVEPYLYGRFGFSGEAETNTNALRQFGIGARVYTMADSRFKIFIEPALAWATEDGGTTPRYCDNPDDRPGGCADFDPQYKKDLIFHVGIGPQYDVAKAFGLFLNLGVDVGVLESLSATLYGVLGAQVRVP